MLIYSGIALFGFLVLLTILLAGDLFGGDHDISAHDAAIDHGDHIGGPSVFSIRIMASFLTAFGVGGVVARYYGLAHPAASGIGIVSGIVMSSLVYQFAKLLYSQQASSEVMMSSLVGRVGQVSVAIPPAGVGQITITHGGQRSEHIARSADGRPLVRGAEVIVTSIRGDSVVVALAESRAPGEST